MGGNLVKWAIYNISNLCSRNTCYDSSIFSSMFSAISIIWDRVWFSKEMLVAPIRRRTSIAIGKAIGGLQEAVQRYIIILVFSPLIGINITIQKFLIVPLMFYSLYHIWYRDNNCCKNGII